MTVQSDPNFKGKLTFCLENGMRNLVNFNSSSGKSDNLHFCQKYVMFELKNFRRVVSGKITYDFKSDIRNLVNFYSS